MSPELVQVVLSATAVILGGAFLEFLRRMLPKTRRAELRTLDAASDSAELVSANAYIITLQAGEKALRLIETELRVEVAALKLEIRTLQRTWDVERAANTDALDHSTREVARFGAELARVRADLVVAQAQIVALGARFAGQHRPVDPST